MDAFSAEHNEGATEWSFAEPLGTPLPKPKRPRGRLIPGAVAVGLLATAGVGVAIGHFAWGNARPATTTATNVAPSTTPHLGGNSGTGFGGNFGQSSGGTGSSGSGSTTSDGPSNADTIATGVDPGLVDIDTDLGDDDGGGEAAGTGMVLTSNGEVLTNNHVIEGETEISVTDIGNGKTYQATVVGYDKNSDVAVLQLKNASGLTTVKTGDSSTVKSGEQVVAIGNAGGAGGTPSYAGGAITAINKSITATDEASGTDEQLTGLLGTDADIQPGDSGGPLVNTSGEVLGMDTAGQSTSGFSFQSSGTTVGFAIPINTALSIAHRIVAGQSSGGVHIGKTAFLGVQVTSPGELSPSGNIGGGGSAGNSTECPSDGEFPGYFCSFTNEPGSSGSGSSSTTTPTTPTSGAEIAGTIAGEPAANAGLAAGDTITTVNGKNVTTTSLSTDLLDLKPGDTARIGYVTASGTQESVNVTLAAGPPQ